MIEITIPPQTVWEWAIELGAAVLALLVIIWLLSAVLRFYAASPSLTADREYHHVRQRVDELYREAEEEVRRQIL